MTCKRIQVFGKVQGVFYRASAKTKADDLKLMGWVRNEADGSVMIEVEGADERITEMIKWCKEGPPFSRVDDVLQESAENRGHRQFQIIH